MCDCGYGYEYEYEYEYDLCMGILGYDEYRCSYMYNVSDEIGSDRNIK